MFVFLCLAHVACKNCPFQMCQGIGHVVPLKTSDLCLLKAMDVIMNPDQPVQTVSVTLLEVRWSPHQFRNALEKKFPNSSAQWGTGR